MATDSFQDDRKRVSLAVSRRGFSRLTLAAVGLAAAGATVGCSPASPEQAIDPLQALADSARADALDFASPATGGGIARLTPLTALRAQHADRLEAEISRLRGGRTKVPISTAPSSPSATTSSQPPSSPSLDQARTRLREAAQAAGSVAVTQNGYRAQLAASIAAACGAAAEVTLA